MISRLQPKFFQSIPNGPGVYFMLDEAGGILYIGKAKRLRRRLCSYRAIKHETHPPHLVELAERICEIRWELCRSEKQAFARESELLHAIRPPYNIRDTEEGIYLFVVVKKHRKEGFLEFQITEDPDIEDGESRIFGCYKNRRQTKQGYLALLRLIYSAGWEGTRFSIPYRISGPRAPHSYALRFPAEWNKGLSRFLRGESLGFLRNLTERLIENEAVPRFMGPSLQDDIDLVRAFFRSGPKVTRLLKRKNKLRSATLSHELMDDLIRRTLSILYSEHPLNSEKR